LLLIQRQRGLWLRHVNGWGGFLDGLSGYASKAGVSARRWALVGREGDAL